MDFITSTSGKTIKYISSLYKKKGRDKAGSFVVEGQRFANEIPYDWDTEFFLISRSFAEKYNVEAYAKKAKIFYAEDNAFKSIADTVSPQGILAVCKQKYFSREQFEEMSSKENPLFILLEQTNDPGNLGAIIRTADAAGASGILLSKDCTDIYSPKVLRSAAGSIFHLPFLKEVDIIEWIKKFKDENINVYAAHLQGAVYPYDIDLKKGCGFVIGNEARGLSDDVVSACAACVKIPLVGQAESLNAAVACGILIYEAVRQRI